MLLGPVDVDGAGPHRLEGAFHADGADVDVRQHRRHEQDRHDGVDDLGKLHPFNSGQVEREHQLIAGAATAPPPMTTIQ